jgi:hypothetical protein
VDPRARGPKPEESLGNVTRPSPNCKKPANLEKARQNAGMLEEEQVKENDYRITRQKQLKSNIK